MRRNKDDSVILMRNKCTEHPDFPMDHLHQCRKCEVVWGHTKKSHGCDACHECPQCGTEQTYHWQWTPKIVVEYDEPVEEIPF